MGVGFLALLLALEAVVARDVDTCLELDELDLLAGNLALEDLADAGD